MTVSQMDKKAASILRQLKIVIPFRYLSAKNPKYFPFAVKSIKMNRKSEHDIYTVGHGSNWLSSIVGIKAVDQLEDTEVDLAFIFRKIFNV